MRGGDQMRLDEVKKDAKDQRGRDITDVFWSTKDYVIYEHSGGVTPQFSDNDHDKIEQRARYAHIGPLLSEINALRSCTAWRAASIDREIARGIADCLEGHLDSAQKTLATVRARLHNLRSIE